MPGRNKYRPSQHTPVPNFTLAGDYTSQKFLGSRRAHLQSGKLAAAVVADKAAGRAPKPVKLRRRRVRRDEVDSAGVLRVPRTYSRELR